MAKWHWEEFEHYWDFYVDDCWILYVTKTPFYSVGDVFLKISGDWIAIGSYGDAEKAKDSIEKAFS